MSTSQPDPAAERPSEGLESAAPGEVAELSIRRAPKIGVFLFLGAVIGTLATLVLTSLYETDEQVGFAATFAYFLIYGIPVGLLLGGLVGLLLDVVSRRRARTVAVEHTRVEAPPVEGELED